MLDPTKDRFAFGDITTTSDLANIAKHHIVTSVCAGGRQVFPSGPCDHCGSLNPGVVCNTVQVNTGTIGEPLQTRSE